MDGGDQVDFGAGATIHAYRQAAYRGDLHGVVDLLNDGEQ